MNPIKHSYDHNDQIDVLEQCNYPDEIVFYGWFIVPGEYTAEEAVSNGSTQYTVAIFKIKYK